MSDRKNRVGPKPKRNPSPEYEPPVKITPEIISLVADISALLGSLNCKDTMPLSLRLNRANRIRTVHGSLAIEGNTLSEEQITAIIEGKRVLAPRREIQEVRNAINAYDRIEKWNPYSTKDLLECHRMLMYALLDMPGEFRDSGVGIMAGKKIIHMAPPAERVPALVKHLQLWVKTTPMHPLISSSIFHYEFEFIHPFPDGNGRLGRLWQTLILGKWHTLFLNVPLESLVFEHRKNYYNAINRASSNGESSAFVEFMLSTILEALKLFGIPEVTPEVTPEVRRLLAVVKSPMTRQEIQKRLGMKDEKHFRMAYIQPAISAGLISMTIPDKPRSRLQKYRITAKGSKLIKKE